ncbi:hypothetical protein [Gordonia zhaorongruii]|uniref:hypothetical protein n=1 Tax=Gordonia zhaorongruii TaxID=2597659 RepID=UPI00117DFAE6|nr:hypothetical protein [Gordonia zhaorongruii]
MTSYTKRCCRCLERKPRSEFYTSSRPSSDGLLGHCKECDKAQKRSRPEQQRREASRRRYKAHRDEIIASKREYALRPEVQARERDLNWMRAFVFRMGFERRIDEWDEFQPYDLRMSRDGEWLQEQTR